MSVPGTIVTLGGGGFSMSDDGTSVIDDHVALVWRDGVLAEAVAERPDRLALRVERDGDRAVEHPLPVRLLNR